MKNEKYFPQITDMACSKEECQNEAGSRIFYSLPKSRKGPLDWKAIERYEAWKDKRDKICLDDWEYPDLEYDGWTSDRDYDEYPSDWEYDGWTSDREYDGWTSDCEYDGWTSDCDGWKSKKDTNSNSRTVSPLSDDHSRENYDDEYPWFYEEWDSSQSCHIPNTPEDHVDEPIKEIEKDDHKFSASSKYNMKKARKRDKPKKKKNPPKVKPARKNGRSYYE